MVKANVTRRRAVSGAMILGLVLLGGCGFRPVYGSGSVAGSASAEQDLAATRIESIEDREGQILRNLLLDRFNPRGRPSKPLYTLTTELSISSSELGTQIDATTTRAQVNMSASSSLTVGDESFSFKSQSVASYSISESDYASEVAKADAIERSLRLIADDLRLQIASFFEKRRLTNGA